MLRGNRMGPGGTGPMTRRGTGYCAGFAAPGYVNPAAGRGTGMADAMPRGGWTAAGGNGDPQREAQDLNDRAEFLQCQLDAVRKRLGELEKDQASE